MTSSRFWFAALIVSLLTSPAALAQDTAAVAQDWPNRPVKIVAPVGPGGVTDTIARLTADRLSKVLGAPFIVENKGGGGGAIGTQYAVRSEPDGYTVYLGGGAQFLSAPLIKKLPYDPLVDLVPVGMVTINSLGLIVSNTLPVNSLSEFLAYVKSNPDKINYGHSGVGQSTHLAAAMLAARESLRMLVVPYKAVPPAIVGLLGGEVQMYFGNISDIIELVRTKKVKLLAISADRRMAEFPDTPTISEAVPNFVFTSWIGYFAPAGTPQPIVEKLSKALAEICRDEEFVARLRNLGIDSVGSTPQELAAAIRNDLPVSRAAVEAAGLLLK